MAGTSKNINCRKMYKANINRVEMKLKHIKSTRPEEDSAKSAKLLKNGSNKYIDKLKEKIMKKTVTNVKHIESRFYRLVREIERVCVSFHRCQSPCGIRNEFVSCERRKFSRKSVLVVIRNERFC